MPLNRDLVGRSYPGVVFEVSRQKLREFATAVGDESAVLHDVDVARAAGHPDLPAAPTFSALLSLEMGRGPREDPELGIDYARIVHGEQRIVLHRPIYAGDVLSGVATIEEIRTAGRHEALVIACRMSGSDGEVCLVETTLISRGTAAEGEA